MSAGTDRAACASERTVIDWSDRAKVVRELIAVLDEFVAGTRDHQALAEWTHRTADAQLARFEALHHKQTYWVERGT